MSLGIGVGLRHSIVKSIDYTNGIFVSKSGNDANPGTYASPVLTLDRANTISTTGKKIYVYPGEYIENNATENCWVVSKATTWRALGEVIVKGTSGNYALIQKTAASLLIGFTIDGETRAYTTVMSVASSTLKNCIIKNGQCGVRVNAPTQKIQGCTFDGQNGGAGYSSIFCERGATITGCTFRNISARSLLYTLGHSDPVTFVGNTATENITGISNVFWLRSSSAVIIEGNTITHSGASLANFILLYGTLASGSFTITDNHFIVNCATSSAVIHFGHPSQSISILFKGNTVDATSTSQTSDIIRIVDKPNVVIDGNFIKSVRTTDIVLINIYSNGQDTTGSIVKNNRLDFISTNSYGIKVGTETTTANNNLCSGAVIENNWIYSARYFTPATPTFDGHQIFVGFNTGSKIKYNHVYGGGLGIILKSNGTADPTAVIAYNVVTNCKHGIRLKGVPGVTIIGNSVYASGVDNHTGIYIDENLDTSYSINVTLKNNIVYTSSSVTTNTLVYVKSGSETGLDMTNNCLKADGTVTFASIAGITYASQSALVTAGFNANGVSENPQYNDAASYVFTLASPSSCINQGADLGEDFKDGQDASNTSLANVVKKDQGEDWDIGAYVS